jgi:hypothetical protein
LSQIAFSSARSFTVCSVWTTLSSAPTEPVSSRRLVAAEADLRADSSSHLSICFEQFLLYPNLATMFQRATIMAILLALTRKAAAASRSAGTPLVALKGNLRHRAPLGDLDQDPGRRSHARASRPDA